MTYEGIRCRAKNAPMTGNFTGGELVIKSELEPKAMCGAVTFTLKKAGGQHPFEGKTRSGLDGYLDPS